MNPHEHTVIMAAARMSAGPLSPAVMQMTLTDLAGLAAAGEHEHVATVLSHWQRALDVIETGQEVAR